MMNTKEIKEWCRSNTSTNIPENCMTEEECLDYITRDCFASGYNAGKEFMIKEAWDYFIKNYGGFFIVHGIEPNFDEFVKYIKR